MTLDDLAAREVQRLDVRRALKREALDDVVGAVVRVQLVLEPQPQLGVGQPVVRCGLSVGWCRDWLGRSGVLGLEAPRQVTEPRRLEERLHGQLAPRGPGQSRPYLECEQAVAPQGEEVVVSTHLVDSEDLAPDSGDRGLGRAPRQLPATGTGVRQLLQRPPVDLAVGGQGELLHDADPVGHHVGGKCLRQLAAQVLLVKGRIRPARHEAAEMGVLVPGAPRDDDGTPHSRQLLQRVLDLSRLDSESPDLDLIVDTTEVLQLPVETAPHHVARSVDATVGIRRMADEAPGGLRLLVLVATGHAVAADVQLTDGPRWDWAHPSVEDIQVGPEEGAPDGDDLPRPNRTRHRRGDRALGRTVHVEQHTSVDRPSIDDLLSQGLAR